MSLKRSYERLYGLGGIGRDVGLSEIDVGRVLTLVPKPSVYGLLGLYKPLEFSAGESALVHVLAFLLVLACVTMVPREALADVTWVSRNQSYGGFVYPYDYTDDGRYAAMADVVGLDWDSMSTTTKQHIREETELQAILENGSCLWNIAYGATYGERPDIVEFLDDLIIQNLFGGSTIYAFALTAADYQYIKDTYEYWAMPRVSPGNGTSTDETNVQSVTLDHPFGKRYYGASNTSWPTVGYEVSGTTVMTNYNPNMIQSTINSFKSLGCKYVYFVAGQGVRRSYGSTTGYGCVYGSASEITANFEFRRGTSGPDYVYIELTSESDIYQSKYGNPSISTVDDNSSVLVDSIKYNGTGNIQNKGTTANYNGLNGSYYVTYVNTNFGSDTYVPTPDPPYVPPELPSPTPTDEPSEPGGGIDIHLPDISFPDITIEDTDGDYTLWLRRIYRAIKTLNQDVQRIGNQLTAGVNTIIVALNDIMIDMDDHCVHIRREIRVESNNLQSYMRTTVRWLESMLAHDLNALETGINRWLRLIYSRLKSRPIQTPSIGDDPADWFQWLTDWLTSVFGGVGTAIAGVLTTLSGVFGALQTAFPFSIPWDLYAILNLFVELPQAPQFVIDWQLTQDMRIYFEVDMRPWDNVMAAVRSVQVVMFGAMLAKLTWRMFNPVESLAGAD